MGLDSESSLFLQGREKPGTSPSPFAAGVSHRQVDCAEDDSGCRTPSLFSTPPRKIHLAQPPAVIQAASACTPQEYVEIGVTRELLMSYHAIVLKSMQNLVPKTVHHFQVNAVHNRLQNYLISHLYKDPIIDDLMTEHEDVAVRRRKCNEAIDIVKKATLVLDSLPSKLWDSMREET